MIAGRGHFDCRPLQLGQNEPTFYAMMIGFQPYCSLSYLLPTFLRQRVKELFRHDPLACSINEGYD